MTKHQKLTHLFKDRVLEVGSINSIPITVTLLGSPEEIINEILSVIK